MKAKLTEEEFINWWLEKYHNTNLDQVKKDHPEWNSDHLEKNSDEWRVHSGESTRAFYTAYMVTEEQHDEWYEWAIQRIMKYYRYSKKRAHRGFSIPSLNVSPQIKEL